MSDNENRDLFKRDAGPQSELLDELDSLKELLREQELNVAVDDSGENSDIDIPMLDEVVDLDAISLEPAPEFNEAQIPVLEEVAFPTGEAPAVEPPPSHSDTPSAASALPSERELNKLVDMLVGHRLRRLRPKIKEEVIEELKRLYPELDQK